MENESKMKLPCMRDKCVGKACNNFGERGCKGGAYPPWSHARWYLEELPKMPSQQEVVNIQGNLKAMEKRQ